MSDEKWDGNLPATVEEVRKAEKWLVENPIEMPEDLKDPAKAWTRMQEAQRAEEAVDAIRYKLARRYPDLKDKLDTDESVISFAELILPKIKQGEPFEVNDLAFRSCKNRPCGWDGKGERCTCGYRRVGWEWNKQDKAWEAWAW